MNVFVNKELSEELKELGLQQESEFYWENGTLRHKNDLKGWHGTPHCSALSVGELGQLLPIEFYSNNQLFRIKFDWGTKFASTVKMFRVYACDVDDENWLISFEDENEANARAKMLIYLIANKLI